MPGNGDKPIIRPQWVEKDLEMSPEDWSSDELNASMARRGVKPEELRDPEARRQYEAFLESLRKPRYFIVESFNRLVKVVGVTAWVYLDGQWHESAQAWRRVQGIGGDADTHEITELEAAAFTGRDKGARSP